MSDTLGERVVGWASFWGIIKYEFARDSQGVDREREREREREYSFGIVLGPAGDGKISGWVNSLGIVDCYSLFRWGVWAVNEF